MKLELKSEEEMVYKSTNSTHRVLIGRVFASENFTTRGRSIVNTHLIVQDPLSRIISSFVDDLHAKTGSRMTSWNEERRLKFKEFLDYTLTSGYRKDQRLHRQSTQCSVCYMNYNLGYSLDLNALT